MEPQATTTSEQYKQTVLRIQAPVAVTLARKNIALDKILDIVPGAMLMFDKNCEEPLTLDVGGQPIAVGETVKVGDKFGLRIRRLLHRKELRE